MTEAGGQRDRTNVADVLDVEFKADHKEQNRHAHLRQQINLVMSTNQTEKGRADENADQHVGDQYGLAQLDCQKTGRCSQPKQHGHFHERPCSDVQIPHPTNFPVFFKGMLTPGCRANARIIVA